MRPLKIIFFGTTDFGLPCLEKLIHSDNTLQAVLCQPDRPNKRGRKIDYSPIKKRALQNKIEVLQPDRIRNHEVVARLKEYQPDLFIVAAYGQILSQEILDIPKYGAINIHGSLLPQYRGAAPIQRAIINGQTKTGVTIMQMDLGMDTGDILVKGEVVIDNRTTFGSLHRELSLLGADLLVDNLQEIIDGKIIPLKQDDETATYAKKLTKETGHITWKDKGDDIVSRINGCDPRPGAYFFLDDQKIKCFSPVFNFEELDYSPGTIIQANDQEGLLIASANGFIKLQEIQAPGKKRMEARLYLRGNPIEKGKVLK